jgi:hypothetical protein
MISRRLCLKLAATAVSLWIGAIAADDAPSVAALIQQFDEYPHTRQIRFSESKVVEQEIGLGAMQKVGGEWHFKHSERYSGTLVRYTWAIENGFSADEEMRKFLQAVAQVKGAEPLFSCDGRACGQAAQWANRVFNESELYGKEDLQHYRVIALRAKPEGRLLVYSAERTEDRQYLHLELLTLQ